MGLRVDEDISPAVMRKVVHLSTRLPSFEAANESVAETLEVKLTTKRVERVTERIGWECVVERELRTAEWEALTLVEKLAAPPGVKAPTMACIEIDGGRLQRCDLPSTAKTRWFEDKVGVLLELEPTTHTSDPCPEIPDKFLDLADMEKVSREIKCRVPKGTPFQKAAVSSPEPEAVASEAMASAASDTAASHQAASVSGTSPARDDGSSTTVRDKVVHKSPKIETRVVVASLADSQAFGQNLAATAWAHGFAAAERKAFVADGSSTNWGIWERHFQHLGFVPIVDFIHALTYVFSASMAGRPRDEGAPIYRRWITWLWQGRVQQVIAELAARAAELGLPTPDTPETDPRHIVAKSLTYLTNQQIRMDYPTYRQAGFPITSCDVESTIKRINYRVKGTEKFWNWHGGEALLQLSALKLSDTAPLDLFWSQRQQKATGYRTNPHKPKIAA